MAVCEACTRGAHLSCEPVPDVEMRFTDCTCLCDPDAVQRYEHVRILIEEARAALQAGRDDACCAAMRRALQLLAPPVRKPPPIRKLALVMAGPTTTAQSSADCYAAASGEPIEPWMRSTHNSERK